MGRSSFSATLAHAADGSLRYKMGWRPLRCSRSALPKFVEPVWFAEFSAFPKKDAVNLSRLSALLPDYLGRLSAMAFSNDSEDTTAMLDRVAAGNPTALEHLLQLHRPYLKRVIEMRMEPALRTRVDASDVAQETQMMITNGIEQFIKNRPTSFRIWIRRKALDQLRDQRRRHMGTMKRSVLMEQNIADVSSIEIARKLLSNSPKQDPWSDRTT